MKKNNDSQTTISKICELLVIAEQVLRTNPNLPMAYTRFKKPDELANEIQKHREMLANTDLSNIEDLYIIFAPTGEWDDCVGESDLANEVCQLLQNRIAAKQ